MTKSNITFKPSTLNDLTFNSPPNLYILFTFVWYFESLNFPCLCCCILCASYLIFDVIFQIIFSVNLKLKKIIWLLTNNDGRLLIHISFILCHYSKLSMSWVSHKKRRTTSTRSPLLSCTWEPWLSNKEVAKNRLKLMVPRLVKRSPSCSVLTALTYTRTCLSHVSRSVTSSLHKVVTRIKSPTPSVPSARVSSIVSSNGSSRSVTKHLTPSKSVTPSSVSWILLVSKFST